MSNLFQERLLKMEKQIDQLNCLFIKKQKSLPDTIFFDNQEFLQLMNISKRTAQQWRSTGYIGFSQLGNKIYYSLKDIQELLNANYNPKKEQ